MSTRAWVAQIWVATGEGTDPAGNGARVVDVVLRVALGVPDEQLAAVSTTAATERATADRRTPGGYQPDLRPLLRPRAAHHRRRGAPARGVGRRFREAGRVRWGHQGRPVTTVSCRALRIGAVGSAGASEQIEGGTLDVEEALYTTRAMRRVRPDPIPLEVQARILDAAIRAPSGGNSQNWRFLLVDDRDVI